MSSEESSPDRPWAKNDDLPEFKELSAFERDSDESRAPDEKRCETAAKSEQDDGESSNESDRISENSSFADVEDASNVGQSADDAEPSTAAAAVSENADHSTVRFDLTFTDFGEDSESDAAQQSAEETIEPRPTASDERPSKSMTNMVLSDESESDVESDFDVEKTEVVDEVNEKVDLEKLAEELDVSESEDEDIVQIFGGNSDDELEAPLEEPGSTLGAERPSDPDLESADEKDPSSKATALSANLAHDHDFVSDFDMIIESRKKERRLYRRRKNVDFINDSDDRMNCIIDMMNKAAKEDRLSNIQQKPAFSKRKLLPKIIPALKRSDWMVSFIDSGLINCISEWLQLLPDKSLPAYEVRHELLKLLTTFPVLDASVLRASNIGKVVGLLSKHPRETKENKALANRLIEKWVRPILNLETNYSCLTHEERVIRDSEHVPAMKKTRLSGYRETTEEDGTSLMENVTATVEKDAVPRARVPKPSTRDYIVRPKWNTDAPFSKKGRAKSTVADRRLREIRDRLKAQKSPSPLKLKVSGSRI